MIGTTPFIWRSNLGRPLGLIDVDVPGIRRNGALEAAEHRRRLVLDARELAAFVLSLRPTASAATADAIVSNSTFVPITGLGQRYHAGANGLVEIVGVLYVEELTAGSFSVRITVAGAAVWTAAGLVSQSTWLLTGTHEGLAKFLLPIGGPALFTARQDIINTLDVEIAAPSGSYKVISGPESWLKTTLNPTIG